MEPQKEKAFEKVRETSEKLREFIVVNGMSPSDLKAYAEMFVMEAELVRLQWMKDRD